MRKKLCCFVSFGFSMEILVENSGSSFTVPDNILWFEFSVLNRQLSIMLIIISFIMLFLLLLSLRTH